MKGLTLLSRIILMAGIFLLLTPMVIFAQSDSTSSGGIGGIVSKIPVWIPVVLTGLYELLVRVVPTAKSWSILSFVMNLINWILPNKSAATYTVKNNVTGEIKHSDNHTITAP